MIREHPLRAVIVKVDPGYTFTVSDTSLLATTLHPPSNPIDLRNKKKLNDIKDTQFASTSEFQIEWKNLNFTQKNRMLETLKEGINILEDENLVDFILKRNGQFGVGEYLDHVLMTDRLEKKFKEEIQLLLEMQKQCFPEVVPLPPKPSLGM